MAKANSSNTKHVCAQIEGIEYEETCAPTGAMVTLRLLLTIGISNGWEVHQMDAKTAFLNSNLDEVIYLRSPLGLQLGPGKCYCLKKSIYGLQQSPRCWYKELVSFFKKVNFSVSLTDSCLFISNNKEWPCLVHVHVDDMTIVSPDVSKFKTLISLAYDMEDLGPIKHILGIKVTRDENHFYLSQTSMIEQFLEEYGMKNSHAVKTPLEPGAYFSVASNEEQSAFNSLKLNYQRAIGLPNYLAVSTRPDLAFPVSILSQHLEKPGIQHWAGFKRILRYLAGTRTIGLQLAKANFNLKVYADASYANCPNMRRSHTGLMVFLDDTLIHWKSRRQSTVSSTSTEAEYKALYEGTQQILWFRKLFNDLSLVSSKFVLSLLGDNQPAIAMAKNPVSSARTMHINIKFHWIREQLSKGLFHLDYVPTTEMHADLLTKALHRVKLPTFLSQAPIKSIPSV
ncbi:hypothetical protein O181_057691 [Austropuccinia psidii MF-1]|uniref:Reverse transcriptase Ty1/copia-type domain-containing protein n=1 Tax=Austropuccinia psidii MF-1 TaxID=1389203 RepID=A0A9Q3HU60_9BASI|nr:hypothetical protein [Austropuccinia psidii MF-1]